MLLYCVLLFLGSDKKFIFFVGMFKSLLLGYLIDVLVL